LEKESRIQGVIMSINKLKITADAVLEVINNLFNRPDINSVVADPEATAEWQGKTIHDILNVEYFAFKHRPANSDAIIDKLKRKGQNVNLMLSTNRSFCSVYVTGTERQFQDDIDVVALSATMEYWVQTPKIKLLELLVENANIAANGLRLKVQIGNIARQAVIIFDEPSVADIQAAAAYGEMAVVEVSCSIIFYPAVTSYTDYSITVNYAVDGEIKTTTIPLTQFDFSSDYTARPVPYVDRPSNVGSLNLSRISTAVIAFEGWDMEFIDWLTAKALSITGVADINEGLNITINRKGIAFAHDMVIQRHEIAVQADITNETHTLSLTTKGLR